MPQRVVRLLGDVAHDGRFGALRGRLRNIGHLLSGNFANALLALAAIALTARGLGPAQYGVLAMAFATARAIEMLVTFQSWQPLIRYGAALDAPDRADDLRSLLKFGLLLDMAGGLIAFAIGAGIALAGGRLLGWSSEVQQTLLLCCLILPFNWTGMATAVLRLNGRYRLAAWGTVTGTLLRLLGSALAFAAGAGLTVYAAVWAGTQALGNMLFLAIAAAVLRERGLGGLGGVLRASAAGVSGRFGGIWRFAWIANISITLRSSANQVDVLIVGAFAGPAAAGLYHIAKRAGRLAEQVSTQAQAVLFPDVARRWAAGERAEMRRAIGQIELVLFLFGVVCTAVLAVIAGPLIRLLLGEPFAGAAPLLVVQMLAVTLAMTGAASRSGLLAMGEERKVLEAVLAGTLLFHALAFTLVPAIGPMGANIAHIGLGLIASGLMLAWCRRRLREGVA